MRKHHIFTNLKIWKFVENFEEKNSYPGSLLSRLTSYFGSIPISAHFLFRLTIRGIWGPGTPIFILRPQFSPKPSKSWLILSLSGSHQTEFPLRPRHLTKQGSSPKKSHSGTPTGDCIGYTISYSISFLANTAAVGSISNFIF